LDISISILKNKNECWKKNPKDFPPTLNIIEPIFSAGGKSFGVFF
jgi:hypothetical protein